MQVYYAFLHLNIKQEGLTIFTGSPVFTTLKQAATGNELQIYFLSQFNLDKHYSSIKRGRELNMTYLNKKLQTPRYCAQWAMSAGDLYVLLSTNGAR